MKKRTSTAIHTHRFLFLPIPIRANENRGDSPFREKHGRARDIIFHIGNRHPPKSAAGMVPQIVEKRGLSSVRPMENRF
ncbi:MAG: hypothetical protein IJL26_10345 [Clostridia bacterium]|nr:hypothetical protein [Clostridia bacterium]